MMESPAGASCTGCWRTSALMDGWVVAAAFFATESFWMRWASRSARVSVSLVPRDFRIAKVNVLIELLLQFRPFRLPYALPRATIATRSHLGHLPLQLAGRLPFAPVTERPHLEVVRVLLCENRRVLRPARFIPLHPLELLSRADLPLLLAFAGRSIASVSPALSCRFEHSCSADPLKKKFKPPHALSRRPGLPQGHGGLKRGRCTSQRF